MESTQLRHFFILAYIISCVEGEIRCYCNEAGCISTGYMCKSAVGMCYSLFTLEGEITSATQGCVDTLVHQKINLCSELGNSNTQSKDFPVLMCCKDDMCNYKDLEKYNVQIRSNGSTQRGDKDNSGSYSVPYSRDDIQEVNSPEKDLWFKAAVIAVPIAGGFILVLLVLLAVRMLRTDTRRSRQLIQFRRERTSLTKAQLYVTDHFTSSHKPEKNSSFFGEKYNSLCKESNTNSTKVDKDGKIYEKVSDKPKRNTPSLIVWGKPSKSDFATIV